MSGACKRRYFPELASPEPKRVNHPMASPIKRNPFFELPSVKPSIDEDLLTKEVRLILTTPSVTLPPISKKAFSPGMFGKIERPPTREKVNPVIFDQQFIALNSSLSTCESWTEEIHSRCN